MYRLFSSEAIVENVITLSLPYVQDPENLDQNNLKKAYRYYLAEIQPHCPHMESSQLFRSDSQTELDFANYFAKEEMDTTEIEKQIDVNNVLYPNAEIRRQELEKAFAQIKMTDPTFAEIFQLVMNTVFCTVTQRIGGTSVNPKFIGVMCAYHDMTAEPKAIPELMIHEFTHNTLFLDELRFGHYHYEHLNDETTYLDASDRGVKFQMPFHRCLHSLIVSAEILLARDAYIGHEPTINQHLTSEKILVRSKKYVATIANSSAYDKIMTERSRELFNTVKNFFDGYQL